SRTDTVCPVCNADVARADPTRPAPTTSTNTARTLAARGGIGYATIVGGGERVPGRDRQLLRPRAHRVDLRRLAVARRGRRGQDHAARRLVDDVARRLPHDRVVQPRLAAEPQPAADAGRLLGG